MRAVLLTLLVGCSSYEAPATETTTETPTAKPAKSREHALAEKILAAIAADDFASLRPMFRIAGATSNDAIEVADQLADDNERGIRRLRDKLDELNIDLAKAKLLRVEGDKPLSRSSPRMFDVFLEANGRVYKTHFSAIDDGNRFQLLGIAVWIVPETT